MTDSFSEKTEDFKRELLQKINDDLRNEGFTEVEIAKINTAIRRALGLC